MLRWKGAGLRDDFRFYNEERLHQALDYQTPQAVYQQRE
jgi:transposase InsO family protein